MLNRALELITNQQGTKRSHLQMIGEQLKDICRREPKAAELVAQDMELPEFSLKKLEKKFDDFAREHKEGGRAVIYPDEADGLIREFFGIPKADEQTDVPKEAASKKENDNITISVFDLL